MRTIALWVLTGWSVLLPASSYAQDWMAVQALPPGTRLRIDLTKERLDGRLREVDAEAITIDGRRLDRNAVQGIDHIRGRRKRGAAVGILVGVGVGMVQSFATATSNKVGFGLWLGARYAVMGGLVGMAVSPPRIDPVYRRP